MKQIFNIILFLLISCAIVYSQDFSERFKKAEKYYLKNDLDKAFNMFNKLINDIKYNNNVKGYSLIYKGKIFIDKENLTTAINIFENIINNNFPNNEINKISYMYLTRLYLTSKKYNPEKATKYSSQAYKIDTKDSDVIYYLAKSYFSLGLAIKEKLIKKKEKTYYYFNKSIYFLNLCLTNKNNLVNIELDNVHSLYGQNYYELDKYETSLKYFNKSLSINYNENVSDRRFWVQLRYADYLTFKKKKQYSKALGIYKELLGYVKKNKRFTYTTNNIIFNINFINKKINK